MAAANASPGRLRAEMLSYPLTIFTNHRLVANCGNSACGGERIYSVGSMASIHGADGTLGQLVRRLRCHRCGRAPVAVIVETGPEEATRGRMHRLSLVGPEFVAPDRNY